MLRETELFSKRLFIEWRAVQLANSSKSGAGWPRSVWFRLKATLTMPQGVPKEQRIRTALIGRLLASRTRNASGWGEIPQRKFFILKNHFNSEEPGRRPISLCTITAISLDFLNWHKMQTVRHAFSHNFKVTTYRKLWLTKSFKSLVTPKRPNACEFWIQIQNFERNCYN